MPACSVTLFHLLSIRPTLAFMLPIAHELGLIDEARWARFNQKMENIEQERQRLRSIWLPRKSAADNPSKSKRC